MEEQQYKSVVELDTMSPISGMKFKIAAGTIFVLVEKKVLSDTVFALLSDGENQLLIPEEALRDEEIFHAI